MITITETKRCWACHGSKLVMGGGCIMKECHVCSGAGFLYNEPVINSIRAPILSKELNNILPDKPKKKKRNNRFNHYINYLHV